MYKRKDRDGCWYSNITLKPYVARRVALSTDKGVSESWEKMLRAAVARVQAGEPARTEELLRGDIPRQTLEVLGLISKLAENRKRTWSDQVDDYCKALAANAKREKYIRNAKMYLNLIAKSQGWKFLKDATRDGFAKFLDSRRTADPQSKDKRRQKGSGLRTIKNIRDTLRAFLRWAVDERRMEEQALDAVRINCDADAIAQDRRRTRRALTEAELSALLSEVAGKPRELVYRFALASGLRWKEIKLLEWRDVQLDERPCLTLRAEATKSRRADEVALSDEIATRLKSHRPAFPKPTDRVFAAMPSLGTWETDLKRAGIEYKLDGKIAGFHSLRVSLGTNLERAGVSPGVRMRIMRHTDHRVSYSSYADLNLSDQHGAVNRMAVPQTAVASANGTDGQARRQNGYRGTSAAVRDSAHPFAGRSGASPTATNGNSEGISRESATNPQDQGCLKSSMGAAKVNSPSRIRTYNLPVNSRPLYR